MTAAPLFPNQPRGNAGAADATPAGVAGNGNAASDANHLRGNAAAAYATTDAVAGSGGAASEAKGSTGNAAAAYATTDAVAVSGGVAADANGSTGSAEAADRTVDGVAGRNGDGAEATPARIAASPRDDRGSDDVAVVIRGLRKRYGGRAVVDGLDLSIGRGELFALLGPNGAGKTTTVEILEGYRKADEGDVRVLGLDPQRQGRELRSRIGLMLQQGGVYPQARPREIVRLYAGFYRHPLDPDALLERVGLADAAKTRYKVLSGGQKQRLGLALALVGRPEIVVLDEPTAGMDPHAKAAVRQLISDLRADRTTVLLTTHELADVERLADRIAVIDRGRLVALGTMAELSAGAQPRLRFRIGRALDVPDMLSLDAALREVAAGAAAVEETVSGAYRIDGAEPDPRLVAALGRWCAERGLLIEELRTGGGTLEERFLELTGGDGPSGQPEAAA